MSLMNRHPERWRRAAALAGLLALSALTLAACERTPDPASPPASPPPTTEAPSAESIGSPAPVPSPAPAAITPDFSPLANLLSVAPGVLSGGMPRGDVGYSALVGMGVQVVISVDAAPPDLERLERFGLRSVHVPTRYSTIRPAEQAAVARAIAEAGGTVYLHCHHGKHRGPAAVAAALRCLDRISPEEAEAFITRAGTSPNYPGLWDAVRTAEPMPESTRLELAPELVARATPADFVAAMADTDRHWDHLLLLAPRDWAPDPAHPDLVAAAEAGILADLFRTMAEQVEARTYGTEFAAELTRSADLAAAFERHLIAEQPNLPAARQAFNAIGASCRSCHHVHRDTE